MIYRVRHARDFDRLRQQGRTVRSGAVRVRLLPDDRDGVHLAFAIGRSNGGAVVRNRLRRQLRNLVVAAEQRGDVEPGWYLVSVDPAVPTTFEQLDCAIRDVFMRARTR